MEKLFLWKIWSRLIELTMTFEIMIKIEMKQNRNVTHILFFMKTLSFSVNLIGNKQQQCRYILDEVRNVSSFFLLSSCSYILMLFSKIIRSYVIPSPSSFATKTPEKTRGSFLFVILKNFFAQMPLGWFYNNYNNYNV